MPLPFKEQPDLPNNKPQAERRFNMLLNKLKGDQEYCNDYVKFVNNLIISGHAEPVPSEDLSKQDGVWYMPHFGVRHPKKKKLRVVFDASAKYRGVSINDLLLSGPDHINSLLGILVRFRREPIAVTCDIQQMFYNFLVAPEHRDYLRFLWTDSDLNTIKEYRMNVHLFGATSSPGVATFGLRKLADDYSKISPEAAMFLNKDFYVDDGVTSTATRQQAENLIKGATTICSKANIRLHKFLSNDKEVLGAVPVSERGESTKSLDIFNDQLPSERTLGMQWCLDSDTFHFTAPEKRTTPTKRGLLSTVAQIYDPMGLVSPYVLKGKQILQKVTAEEKSWDQMISPEDQAQWEDWTKDFIKLTELRIPRCFKIKGNRVTLELHHFADASLLGYGACSYIRQINDQGEISCHLILAKSRVAPLRKLTIPRLELQGAVTATRLANTLRKELKLTVDREMFWTDSKIVLGYIANDSRRFHMYVANRVSEIRESTSPDQWHYVPTAENPADSASRGATAAEIIEDVTWYEGPAFLKELELTDYIGHNQANQQISEADPEVRSTPLRIMKTSTTSTTNLTEKFVKFSSWNKLVRSIAILKSFARQKRWRVQEISTDDTRNAETFIIQELQAYGFPAGPKEDSLVKLHPITDNEHVLRVGGRASAAGMLNELQKHPILIPKRSHVAYLLTKHFHEKVEHLGRRSTLAAIRDAGYWIVSGANEVKRLLRTCVDCAKLRKNSETQLMGELPKERLESSPPFTHIGVDVFGPYFVKDRRTELKRWGLLVTCLYSRAIHIELLEDMTTDTFMQAIRCVSALRGPIQTIYCDNGTNFVGAKNELEKESLKADGAMKQYLFENRIEFKFNSPNASHQGGVTERMIRSAKAVLNGMSLTMKNRLDTKTLRTVFYEAANIVNNRPLTATSIADPEEQIITPNHLLTMKTTSLATPPPGEFPEEDIYCGKRWKTAQHMAEEFWRAWRTEYLQDITTRRKWTKARRNVKVGDVVIVKDHLAIRNDWKIGIVIEANEGCDGLVRNVRVRLGNSQLDRKGKAMSDPTILKRSVQKLVVIVEG